MPPTKVAQFHSLAGLAQFEPDTATAFGASGNYVPASGASTNPVPEHSPWEGEYGLGAQHRYAQAPCAAIDTAVW
jgi:hypothetical protein